MRKMNFQFGSNLKVHSLIPLTMATLAAGVFAAACQQASTDNASTEGTDETPAEASGDGLKLGALLPATGDLSSIGQPMLDALPLLVETVNACGGVNDAPVTLIIEDTQTDPTAGAEAMTKLAEADQVHGVVGAFASSVSSAAVDVAVRNQVPMVSPGSTSPVFTERAEAGDFEGYWARTAPPDVYQAQASAQLAMDRGLTSVATAVINNDYGVGYEQAFVEAFESLGGTVVNKDNPVRYDPKATTFDSEASAAFGGDPDAVLGVLYVETGALLLKSAYEQGLKEGVQVILTDGVQTESFPEDVGQTSEGSYILSDAIGTVPGAAGPALEDFTALWEEQFGEAPGAFVPHTWDAAAVLVLAAQAAGENDGEAIKDQIRAVSGGPGTEVTDVCEALELINAGEDINYQGASGQVDIDENGDVIGSYDVWTVTQEGKIEVVDKVILE
ncbi:MAG: ABC transporter substrate-binding protein [Elainellaceae cyanobacterium]